ncbi:MAG: NAD-dependent epimerase/dehydratase family protein [Candidatus Jacksonbacteria bacterium]|jgi:UDP-glucuronate decarboxylase|nr:NAD-dependent epimerase/dehydratase family protein [Candidatus Jacksonbacteria bacterium]MBT6034201.1 NAD-dependent epimerase/dehydratase family protein [Candidatus Jacksonbacteria bacterium]MBT6301515.1 NAD-dependent epimerase/dehydratase family protein [Candidatus Jacksonbacteria bacterium]MBT6757566.1 NAD-dependent epimerase/dehydratase family protein [Candidatus Jacksonbacteria bacterium]MBT6955296.1 NAD-dependent epimerase/dehydratase family protein [Candidatus Jacksonbacteria bacterium
MHFPSGKKNILVTGGAGFLGSQLCEVLVKQHHVICVDDLSTGFVENVQHLLQLPDFELVRHDLTLPLDLAQQPDMEKFQMEFQGVQEVYHLASPSTPKDHKEQPLRTAMAASHATYNALQIAKKWKAKFLFTSSSWVYGQADHEKLVPETYWGYVDQIGPKGAYAEGKRFAEMMIYWFGKENGIDTKIARVASVYGPHMKLGSGRLIADIVENAMNNEPIVLHSNKKDAITVVYVLDIVEGLLKMMASDQPGPMNFSANTSYTLNDLINAIQSIIGSKSQIIEKNEKEMHQHAMLDISLAKEALGWYPVVSMEEGLKKTVDSLRAMRVKKPTTNH